MATKIRIIKKPTPIRNALLVFSVTCNLFLGTAAYAVYNGQLARTDITTVQPVALHNSDDYLTTIAGRK